MKNANRKLTIVLLVFLVTLASLAMVTGCKKKGRVEKSTGKPINVEQYEEDANDVEW